jgi:hypothetical protein
VDSRLSPTLVLGLLGLLGVAGLLGCARTRVPDPRDAARQYEEALEQGDAARLHALLSRRAQATYSEADLALLMKRDGKELLGNARGCVDPAAKVAANASMTTGAGLELGLELEEGAFRIDSDTALFPRPGTPEAAARALIQALASGQVERVEAILSSDRRADLEERRAALLESLSGLDQASVRVRDHRATIELPDGQVLELVEEEGVWRVEAVP